MIIFFENKIRPSKSTEGRWQILGDLLNYVSSKVEHASVPKIIIENFKIINFRELSVESLSYLNATSMDTYNQKCFASDKLKPKAINS